MLVMPFGFIAHPLKIHTQPSNQNGILEKLPRETTSTTMRTAQNYRLIWSDEFNGAGEIDPGKWSFCPRGTPAWTKYLTARSAYAYIHDGMLMLKMDNSVITGDTMRYHSGGIQSSRKFNFKFGKVDVRAKFNQGKGSGRLSG